MKPYLRNILILVVILLAATLIYLQFNNQQSDIQVDTVTLTENGQVGVYGPVGLQFDRPMDQASVEDRISFTPKTPGRFVWDQNTVWFYPDEPIDPMQGLSLSLRSGAKSSDDETLNLKMEWDLSIRSTEILYLVLAQDGGDLWRWSFTEQAGTALTDTGGKIIDFDPNRVGEAIVYAAVNDEGGSDLWTTDRDGTSQTLIVDCGSDYCSQPAWSMDSTLIAYARQGRNEATGLLQASQIWLHDNHTLETTPLYPEADLTGELPSFSPDGQLLAFYNLSQRTIQILHLETAQEILIPTEVEEMGDWSSDGSKLLFTDLIQSALEPEAALFIADLTDQSVERVLQEDSEGTIFSQPRYTPDGEWIAVSLRAVNSTSSKALWVLKLDASEIQLIANTPAVTFTSYHWSPSGQRLIYQSLETGSPGFPTSVWLWQWGKTKGELIIEDAARPVWLP